MITMPALSSTMKEGKISSWLMGVGDKVDAGDMVLVVESDKADMDVETYEEGYIAKILVPEGGTAAVGAPVAIIVEKEEDIAAVAAGGAPPAAAAPAAAPEPAAAATAAVSDVAIPVMMPALSSTMKEGKISSWLVGVGDKVDAGDMLLVVESDKADMDVESFEEGYVAKILVAEGEVAQVGSPVALLAPTEAEIAAVAASAGTTAAPAAAPAAAAPTPAPVAATPKPAGGGYISPNKMATPAAKKLAKSKGLKWQDIPGTGNFGRVTEDDVLIAAGEAPKAAPAPMAAPAPVAAAPAAAPVAAPPASGRIVASPFARSLAEGKGVDLATVIGTGPDGRIVAADVEKAALAKAAAPAGAAPVTIPKPAAPSGPAPAGVVPMTGMQKAVVRNMAWADNVPTYTVSRQIITDEFDALYAQLKPKGVTVSALLAKAVGLALAKHPIINSNYVEDGINYNADINVAMAVAMPDGGLITPVLKNADATDIYSLGRSWKDLVSRAMEGKLKPDEYSSGTFTISNLGMFGVSTFVSILPPNTGAILAVAASQPTAVLQKNGMMGMAKVMTVTMTCDHRNIYGADAAKFLKDLANIIENETQSLLL